ASVGGYVTSLYRNILERAPDAPGLQGFLTQLASGVSRTQVAQEFWTSTEHHQLEVDQFYHDILNRVADPLGRAGWISALDQGMSETDVVVRFLTSAEYTASHPDDFSFVQGLYNDVLGRAGNASEVAGWVQVLQSGARDRASVAFYFLTSDEAYLKAIDNYYADFLGRGPDAPGLQGWMSQLVSGGATPASVTAAFLSSPEYIARQLALFCSGSMS